jgi:hypothetical protein
MVVNLENRIIDHIKQKGPLTGLELVKSFDEDGLALWQACMRSQQLVTTRIGKRYLRLDRRVDGFARLSPSILREFLSYSVMGLAEDPDPVSKKACEIASHIETVSKNKLELAHSLVSNVRKQCSDIWEDKLHICFIIAGDIVYNMAHDAPRPEQSIGEFVKGSDIDLVVVLEDSAPDDFIKGLDRAIYSEKYRLLTAPAFREEIDYIVKRMSRVREQLQFDTLKRMIACKILDEGLLLCGSKSLFTDIKTLLNQHGVTEKLGDLEKKAQALRKDAEDYLLHADPDRAKKESPYLFYPAEESEEFE